MLRGYFAAYKGSQKMTGSNKKNLKFTQKKREFRAINKLSSTDCRFANNQRVTTENLQFYVLKYIVLKKIFIVVKLR